MALINSLAALTATAFAAIIFAAFGRMLLRAGKPENSNSIEDLLLSVAAGVITFQVAVALISYTGKFRVGIGALVCLLVVVAAHRIPGVLRDLFGIVGRRKFDAVEKIFAAVVFVVLLVEGLSAVAPLTGSDALHYHFTTAKLYLENGFHPIFSIVHSFLIGQSHTLILTGLSLGSEKLALGLLYLGGVLTAAAAACLARRLASTVAGWLAALAFLVTPIIFWQMTVAGAPDCWMAFFTTMAVVCIARYREHPSIGLVFLIGMLGGAVAGAKYSGCILAICVVLAFFWEERSLRMHAVLLSGMLCAGIWPYLRNFLWTRDPFFPFGVRLFAPSELNSYTLASLMADTGTNHHSGILKMPFFATFAQFDPQRPGFFQYFGPLCLVFAPFLLISIRNSPLWRAVMIVWLASNLSLAASSDLTRFSIPVFPIALAVSVASVTMAGRTPWRLPRTLAILTLAIVLLMGIGGLLIYERPALAVSLGLTHPADYLRARAPDYDRTQFVNQNLPPDDSSEKALVFFQHLYYLKVPFVYGDPSASWLIDPQKFHSTADWLAFFRREHIRWVVCSPEYPDAIAAPLQELESSRLLVPLAQGETNDFVGMRAEEMRQSFPIVILLVQQNAR